MIPVKDARKVLYDSAIDRSLSDLQGMFGGVVGVEKISNAGTVGLLLAIEFDPAVEGLAIESGPTTDGLDLHLRGGNTINGEDVLEGVKIPFYFIEYISD